MLYNTINLETEELLLETNDSVFLAASSPAPASADRKIGISLRSGLETMFVTLVLVTDRC